MTKTQLPTGVSKDSQWGLHRLRSVVMISCHHPDLRHQLTRFKHSTPNETYGEWKHRRAESIVNPNPRQKYSFRHLSWVRMKWQCRRLNHTLISWTTRSYRRLGINTKSELQNSKKKRMTSTHKRQVWLGSSISHWRSLSPWSKSMASSSQRSLSSRRKTKFFWKNRSGLKWSAVTFAKSFMKQMRSWLHTGNMRPSCSKRQSH